MAILLPCYDPSNGHASHRCTKQKHVCYSHGNRPMQACKIKMFIQTRKNNSSEISGKKKPPLQDFITYVYVLLHNSQQTRKSINDQRSDHVLWLNWGLGWTTTVYAAG